MEAKSNDKFMNEVVKNLKSTVNFFVIKSGTKNFPIPTGSGILFSQHEKYYILSNSHVIGGDSSLDAFLMSEKKGTILPSGELFFTKLVKRVDSAVIEVDVSILKLRMESVEILLADGYVFLDGNQVNLYQPIKTSDVLVICGSPGSLISVNPKTKLVELDTMTVRTSPTFPKLSKLGYSETVYHFAKFPRKFISVNTNLPRRSPKPHGLSGSGLWKIQDEASGNYNHLLIGILCHYLDNRSLVVAIKFEVYFDFIRQYFDSTIPKGPTNFLLKDDNNGQ